MVLALMDGDKLIIYINNVHMDNSVSILRSSSLDGHTECFSTRYAVHILIRTNKTFLHVKNRCFQWDKIMSMNVGAVAAHFPSNFHGFSAGTDQRPQRN